MTQQVTILLIVAVTNVLLGFAVLSRSPKTRALQLFCSTTVFISAWAICNFFTENATILSHNIIFNRLAYITAFLTLLSLVFFSYYFPKKIVVKKRTKYALFTLATVGLVFSASDAVVGDVYYNGAAEVAYIGGSLLVVYSLMLFFMTGLVARNLIRVYRISSGRERHQSKVMIIGLFVVLFFGMLTNAIVPLFVPSWYAVGQFVPFLSLVLVTTITYAIAKYGLFDIRPMLARSIAYILALGAVVFAFAYFIYLVAQDLLGLTVSTHQGLVLALLIAVAAIAFQPVRVFFDKISNHIFFRDSYDSQTFLNSINTHIATTTDLEDLLEGISEKISQTIRSGFCEFYLEPQSKIELHLVGSNKWIVTHAAWSLLSKAIKESDEQMVSIEDIYVPQPTKDLMRSMHIDLVIKMTSNGEEVGYMIIGQKRNHDIYTVTDIQVLSIVADEVALAVQSGLRFKEIERFNETLQQKIDDATQALKKSNQKLRLLDETKDEFISMASHQLRTPLTSIKGYVSMMLEGDAGEITEQQKMFLNQAYTSSQRMVYLIADLLNVSRLKTGKFVIERTEVYLPDLVRTEVEQLATTAESRGLKLLCKLPETYPTLSLDETKTRQVVMNFIDNAIYYTPKGGSITVELKVVEHRLARFTVRDNGIGVPEPDQHLLFTKFYRAANARKARPDGTGLGLYMAKKVVTAQGGELIFKTSEGKGSTFGFSFPYAMLEPDNKPQQKTT